jgi:hypothetical protein
VWDIELIEHFSHDEEAWLKSLRELDTPGNRAAYAGGSAVDWANESLTAAKNAYRVPRGEPSDPPG